MTRPTPLIFRLILPGLIGAAALTVVIAMTSRIFTDRSLLSQFAFWAPLWVYGITTTALCVCVLLVRWVQRRMRFVRLPLHELAHVSSEKPGLRWAATWLMLMVGMILVGAGWNTSRTPEPRLPQSMEIASTSSAVRGASPPPQLRIVHWNLTSPDTHTWPGVITDIPECKIADLLLLGVTMDDAQFARVMEPLSSTHTIRRVRGLAVASRFEILRFQHIALNLDSIVSAHRVNGNSPEPWYQTIYNDHAESLGISRREFDLPDPGYLIDLTIATPEGPTTFWFIDLPSNPFVSRMRIAAAVRARLTTEKLAFPVAIIGDFNIPGGSASLRTIAPEFRSAAENALDRASGPTWPRARPFLDIDHALVHPSVTASIYRTFDPGISDHWGQYLTLTGAAHAASESAAR